jgi:hypothetical protein
LFKKVTWTTKTCDCKFEYVFDDEVDVSVRKNIFFKQLNSCRYHTDDDPQVIFDQASENNIRKNNVLKYILETFPQQLGKVTADGSTMLKDGIEYSWDFSGLNDSRVLQISIKGYDLTDNQKLQIQNYCNSEIGIGKVIVQ